MQNLHVLNSVAQARRMPLFFFQPQKFENIQYIVVGAVADGMDGQA